MEDFQTIRTFRTRHFTVTFSAAVSESRKAGAPVHVQWMAQVDALRPDHDVLVDSCKWRWLGVSERDGTDFASFDDFLADPDAMKDSVRQAIAMARYKKQVGDHQGVPAFCWPLRDLPGVAQDLGPDTKDIYHRTTARL